MKIIIAKDYEDMSAKAFEIVAEIVRGNPEATLGLATGTTPIGLYRNMIRDFRENGTSYRRVRTVNLDEYVGLGEDNEQSYAFFMRKYLFDEIDIDRKNTHIENGKACDRAAECERYNALLRTLRQDVQILGIGSNGHIAFNEPGTPFDSETHVVDLAESTIRDNARLFSREEDVPRQAFTMGLKNIMNARKIIVLANGANKAKAVYGLAEGEMTERLPASVLQLHADCTLIADKSAASLLSLS